MREETAKKKIIVAGKKKLERLPRYAPSGAIQIIPAPMTFLT
jgi:hypothetical protein